MIVLSSVWFWAGKANLFGISGYIIPSLNAEFLKIFFSFFFVSSESYTRESLNDTLSISFVFEFDIGYKFGPKFPPLSSLSEVQLPLKCLFPPLY